jgi:hypothetical protein
LQAQERQWILIPPMLARDLRSLQAGSFRIQAGHRFQGLA